jgi:uncharacterized repeat protein (TIGR01451 family)
MRRFADRDRERALAVTSAGRAAGGTLGPTTTEGGTVVIDSRWSSSHRRGRRIAASIGVLLATVQLTAVTALATPGVTPSSVSATLLPGGSTVVAKTVETPPIPPDPDIVFMADTTSSMSGAIANVQTNAATIMTAVLGAQPTAEFGVAHYTDQACPDPWVLDQAITADTTAVTTALAGLTTPNLGCNPDAPEDYINGVYQVATDPTVGFRTGSTRIVVFFGDSSSHDPSAGITLGAATAALQAAEVRVVAINVPGTSGYLYDGLDHYGQATALATATGGVYLDAPTVGEIADTILAGLTNLPVTVTHSVSCDPGLTVDITPASQTVTSGDSTAWSETISVDPSDPGGMTLHCTVDWLLDGDLPGPAFVQSIAIEVPGADLAVVKSGPTLVTEGDTFSYTLTVTNNGPADATDVSVTDPLPANSTFVSADAGCSESSGTVTCAIGSLAAGAIAARQITVTAGSAGTDLTNTATVSAHQTDPDPTNDSSTVVTVLNHDPTCTQVTAGDPLWPPNHKLQLRTLTGAFDVDGDAVTTTVLGVTQDEALDGLGDGDTSPDALAGPAGDQVRLRAERSGTGDGRVYRVSFTVTDGLGGECSGVVTVGVPHDQRGQPAVDSGDVFVDF